MNKDYSNHFLTILGKLDRRNKIIFLSLFLIFACTKVNFSHKVNFFHTEISCPGKSVILVRYATLEEVRASIIKGIEDKKRFKTTESYTVILVSGNRSTAVNIPPEEMLKCSLRAIPVTNPDKNITKDTDY